MIMSCSPYIYSYSIYVYVYLIIIAGYIRYLNHDFAIESIDPQLSQILSWTLEFMINCGAQAFAK